jgi:uncharacterized protein YcnI
MNRFSGRLAAVLVLGVALAIAVPSAADAHIRLAPGQAQAGAESTQLTFSVPTETEGVATTSVELDLPSSAPFAKLSVEPVPGWTARATSAPLAKPVKVGDTEVTTAFSRVVWTAGADTKLVTGQFQNFVIAVGPMPSVGRIKMTALQTLSNGAVLQWNEEMKAGEAEPEHPAPVLYVKDTPPAGGMVMGSGATMTVKTVAADPVPAWLVPLAVAALAVGLASLILAGLLWWSVRRTRAAAAAPRGQPGQSVP